MSLYVEIGYGKNEQINVEEQLKLTLKNLERVGIITDNKLVEYNHIIMDPAYVHINTRNMKQLEGIKTELECNDIYTIGRYGGWTYCSMEDCMISAKELVKKIK